METAQICIWINVRTLDIHTSIHVNPYKHTCNSVQQMFNCMQDLLILVQTCMWVNVINMEHNTNMSKPSGRYENKKTIIMIVTFFRSAVCAEELLQPGQISGQGETQSIYHNYYVSCIDGMRRRKTLKSLYNPWHSCTQAKFPGREKHKLIIIIIVIFV